MKIEITVPTSLDEIPLKNYQKFMDVAKNSNDNDFVSLKMLECFCGIELKEAYKLKTTDVFSIASKLNELFEIKGKFQHRFSFKGIDFGFINDLENISYGEYLDIEEYLKDVSTFHKAMAVMYRPIKETKKDKYSILDYDGGEEYHDFMQYVPLSIVLPATLFFWTLGIELLEATTNFLQSKLTKEQLTSLAKKHNLASSGDGINQYTNSLRETLQNSMKLQSKGFINV